jgi:hypothetical protein
MSEGLRLEDIGKAPVNVPPVTGRCPRCNNPISVILKSGRKRCGICNRLIEGLIGDIEHIAIPKPQLNTHTPSVSLPDEIPFVTMTLRVTWLPYPMGAPIDSFLLTNCKDGKDHTAYKATRPFMEKLESAIQSGAKKLNEQGMEIELAELTAACEPLTEVALWVNRHAEASANPEALSNSHPGR